MRENIGRRNVARGKRKKEEECERKGQVEKEGRVEGEEWKREVQGKFTERGRRGIRK